MAQINLTQEYLEVLGVGTFDIHVTQEYLEVLGPYIYLHAKVTTTLTAAGSITKEAQASLLSQAALASIPFGYVTTDSFTEAGDTALTSHTDDEGNSWSLADNDVVQVSGANDNVEVK